MELPFPNKYSDFEFSRRLDRSVFDEKATRPDPYLEEFQRQMKVQFPINAYRRLEQDIEEIKLQLEHQGRLLKRIADQIAGSSDEERADTPEDFPF